MKYFIYTCLYLHKFIFKDAILFTQHKNIFKECNNFVHWLIQEAIYIHYIHMQYPISIFKMRKNDQKLYYI